MNTTEFKAGQRWRVIDAEEFNAFLPDEYARVRDGDLLIAIEMEDYDNDHWKMRIVNSAAVTLACSSDIAEKCIVLSEDGEENSTDTTEVKVGQKYRVIDPYRLGYTAVNKGDILTVKWFEYPNYWYFRENVFMFPEEATNGTLELVGDTPEAPIEASEDVSELPRSEALEGAESVSQGSTDSPSSKDILWHIISRAERYNGHSQFTVSEMDLSTLITLTRVLDDYVTEFCELRLSWGGDHMGYYTADIYEIASARDDSKGKILMQIEKVTGVG